MKKHTDDRERRAGRGERRWLWLLMLLAALLWLTGSLGGTAASPPAWPQPVASGGGEYVLPEADHISEAQRAEIEAMIQSNIDQLMAEGALSPQRAAQVALGWPLAGRDGFADPGFHAISGFVDHQAGYPNQLLDYACGARTYDTSSGYNHKGTDYFLWPFPWNKMAAGDVQVVAAADGVIVGRKDGYPDQSCNFNSNDWNAVYVRHADGSTAWYGHLKQNSVTAKGLGATVQQGEYLGLVGSSGNSTGPHLHFELYNGGALIDPYAGSCNPLAGGSWWAAQREYYDSAVNKLMTGVKPVTWNACPQPDVTNEATQFQPGNAITFTVFYRDQLNSQPSLYRIKDPSGAIYTAWTHTSNKPHYPSSYWWWGFNFPVSVKQGVWQFEVTFNGKTTTHAFTIGQSPTPTPSPNPSPTATSDPNAWRSFVPAVLHNQ